MRVKKNWGGGGYIALQFSRPRFTSELISDFPKFNDSGEEKTSFDYVFCRDGPDIEWTGYPVYLCLFGTCLNSSVILYPRQGG